MTNVAICTVNWNGKKDTEELLTSFSKLDTTGLSIKTFVVSNQKELFFLKNSSFKRRVPFKLIFKRKNLGSAGGYNLGAKAALKWGADFILLVNNDILINDPSILRKLVKTAKSHPDIGLVSPKLYFAPGFEFQKNRYTPSNRGHVIWYAGGTFDWNNVLAVHRGIDEVDSGKYDRVEPTGFVSGSAMLVSRAIFDRHIFWDESLFAYLDDNDFQQRVHRAGFQLYYDGATNIYHKVSRTAGIGSSSSDYYLTRNRLIFGMRYAPLRTKVALLREAARLLVSGRPMQKRGVIDFFRGIRGALDHQTTS